MSNPDSNIHTYLNPYSYLTLRKNGLLEIVHRNFKIEYDSFLLVALNNLIGLPIKNRHSFDDTSDAPLIIKKYAYGIPRIGIIGSSSETISKAKKILESRYGNIILYCQDGYFSYEAETEIIKNFSRCDLVICSMGAPKQEIFLLKLADTGWTGSGYTCGGYFDQLVVANGSNYYPSIINKLNLRWAYRIYKEPRRLWRRYLFDYPIGCVLYCYDQLIKARSRNS